MTTLVIKAFGGETPMVSDQKINPVQSTEAKNCWLVSGDLRGLNVPELVQDFTADTDDVKSVRRIRDAETASDIWVRWAAEDVDFVKGPLVNDTHNRYYWTTSEPEFAYAPKANLGDGAEANRNGYLVGVPRPDNAPVVTPDGSGTGLTVTRSYVYTFVSEYGEEGPPSDPATESGKDDDVWNITAMDITHADFAGRNITKKRIYRTVTGQSGATVYHFVVEIPVGDASYADSNPTDEVALNDPCESWSWYIPPNDLTGLITHPNGFLVAFRGRDVWFSESYRPHAWPPEYVLSVDHHIIGLAIFGTSIAVLTDGHPYISTGITPASVTLVKVQTPEPCVAKKAIVPILGGVLYPSTHGINLMGKQGVENLTENIFTREEWAPYATEELQCARYNDQYVGFHTATDGILVSPGNKLSMFSQLSDFWEIESIWTDEWSGEVYLLQNKQVLTWNPPGGIPLYHSWTSMEFVTPTPLNLGAYQIDWRAPPDQELSDDFKGDPGSPGSGGTLGITGRQVFNVPNLAVINDIARKDMTITEDDTTEQAELDPGSPLATLPGAVTYEPWLTMRVWADGILRFETQIKTTEVARMPSGFKARRWKFQFVGNGTIKTAKFGTTGLELANV